MSSMLRCPLFFVLFLKLLWCLDCLQLYLCTFAPSMSASLTELVNPNFKMLFVLTTDQHKSEEKNYVQFCTGYTTPPAPRSTRRAACYWAPPLAWPTSPSPGPAGTHSGLRSGRVGSTSGHFRVFAGSPMVVQAAGPAVREQGPGLAGGRVGGGGGGQSPGGLALVDQPVPGTST